MRRVPQRVPPRTNLPAFALDLRRGSQDLRAALDGARLRRRRGGAGLAGCPAARLPCWLAAGAGSAELLAE